jgi:putative restriction endonuclease
VSVCTEIDEWVREESLVCPRGCPGDYLDLTVSQAREQYRALAARRPVASGKQVTFLPVETLLCLATSFVVNAHQFGGATADRAPEPVPSLARLFSRPPSSVLSKMFNLDGSRTHGGRWDVLAGATLRDDPARFRRNLRVAALGLAFLRGQ